MEPGKLENHEISQVLDSILTGPEYLPINEHMNQFEDAWEEAQAGENWSHLDSAWKEAENHHENNPWVQSKQMSQDEFCEFWQHLWPSENFQEIEYTFDESNPFLGRSDLSECLSSSLLSGQISESIQILEALVLKDPSSSECWILLGKLNAENDEDNHSISALKRGYSLSPSDPEAKAALGIGLINAKQGESAMHLLTSWLLSNPIFQSLTSSSVDLKDRTIDLLIQASSLKPEDSSLQQVLGSLYFMMKDYDLAVSAFENSVALDPQNYYSWNRLGAALAHQGQNEKAVQAYHKAIEIRPYYVRAWANLGIAHANMDRMVEACQFYLCALKLNPKAFHVWNYLVTAFTCLSKG
jgi:peroxin-5